FLVALLQLAELRREACTCLLGLRLRDADRDEERANEEGDEDDGGCGCGAAGERFERCRERGQRAVGGVEDRRDRREGIDVQGGVRSGCRESRLKAVLPS